MSLHRKSFETVQEPIKAEASDLSGIRKYALREVQPEEVWTGSMKLCHDRVDRTYERFPKAYLERFAATLPGKSVMPGHDYSQLPLGRFYGAEVLPDSEGHHLRVRYYLPRNSPLVEQIELGVLKDVSIGFHAGKRLCDTCGKAWDFSHEHFPGAEYDGKTCTVTYCETEAHKAEAMEGSFVWCGAQPGAEAVALAAKSGFGVGLSVPMDGTTSFRYLPVYDTNTFSHSYSIPIQLKREESSMFKTLDEANAEGPRLQAEIERLKGLPLAAAREAELQKALADKEPLAKDGGAYRQAIRDNIARMALAIDEAEKHQGKTAAKAEMYTAILATMPADASAESLLAVEKGLKSEFEARFAQSAAHGNGPEPHKEEEKPGLLRRLATGGYW